MANNPHTISKKAIVLEGINAKNDSLISLDSMGETINYNKKPTDVIRIQNQNEKSVSSSAFDNRSRDLNESPLRSEVEPIKLNIQENKLVSR
jgi:hypothetical protein